MLADLLADPSRLGAGAGPSVLAEACDLLESAAAAGVAVGGWTVDEPLRLAKRSVRELLTCPRRALVDSSLSAGGDLTNLVLGDIVDAGAKLATLGPRVAPTVDDAVRFLTASGSTFASDHLASLSPDAAADLRAEAAARLDPLVASWPVVPGAWWPRVEEPARLRLAGGAVVVSGKLDILLGGPPTTLPGLVVELKAGRWFDAVRYDGHLYALLVGLRDGVAPAAVLSVCAGDGATQLEPIRPEVLLHAAERVAEAIAVAAPLAAGEPAAAHPNPACPYCPPPPLLPRSPRRGSRMTGRSDAVGWADGVRTDVAGRLSELVEALSPDADPGTVYVGWFAAAEVAGCPARFRAGGVDGWEFPGWSPQSAAASVGRSALARCVDRSPELPDPLGTVKAWMRDVRSAPTSYVAEWITHLSQTGAPVDLAATAALAARWIAGFVRVVGWPFPEKLALVVDDPDSPSARRGPPPWRPRLSGRRVPISVASKPDAVAGTVAPSGRFDVLFHRPNSGDDLALAERAAFEAAATALAIGIVPAHVVLSAADTGERLRFPVDDALLARGADQVVDVIRHRLQAAEPLPLGSTGFDDATPSPACRYCPTAEGCPPGQAWLTHPTRRHNGLPVLAAPFC